MNMNRALVCSYTTPQLDRDSGSRRIFEFIQFLGEEGWGVTYLASNGIGDPRDARVLQQRGVAVYDGSCSRIDELLAAGRFDLAILVFWPIAGYYLPIIRKLSPATRVIVDSIDLHFLRDARRILHTSMKSGSAGLLDPDYAAQMIAEVNAYAAADAVLAVSQKEADLINDFVGESTPAFDVPLIEDLNPSSIPFAERKGILSVGSYHHPPNIQAVEYLCKEIVPRLDPALLAEHPVYIVGNGLDETVRSYGRDLPHVRMVGWVPSVVPYFERARISVIPLLYGAGVKGKLVQALMIGTPTVSTSIGTEGLNLHDGKHVLVADDPDTFAKAITRLLEDEQLWHCLAQQGYDHIARTHSREAGRTRFLEAIEAALAKDPKPMMLAELSPEQHQDRVNYQYYQQLMPHIRRIVSDKVPPESTVAVISGGSRELLKLGAPASWHFPQNADGEYAGNHPESSAAAIAHLEELRNKGADFLLVPSPAFWWLDYYPEFRQHLQIQYPEVACQKDVCLIYALGKFATEQPDLPTTVIQQSETISRNGNGLTEQNLALTKTILKNSRPATHEPATVTDYGNGNCSLSRPEEPGGVKLIAFYLPQYHPIPENDEWWGEGFTEWRNVVKAQPLFPGHYQPRLPSDLGFYDLRCPETRQEQADLAREHGIHGFCYYHYWFNGKRLLERPFDEVLTSGRPDFPFCLCWANEPWSRRWDGRPRDILQPQSYSEEDDIAHIRWLMPALQDPRAIRIEGKPLFMVYQARDLAEPARTVETWRREVQRAGLEGIYLMTVETGWDAGWDATKEGFDAKVLFMPQFSMLFNSGAEIPVAAKESLRVYDYQKAWPILANPDPVPYRRYETVFPSWDNSARCGDSGVVLHNSTPETYEQWLQYAITKAQIQPPDQRIVFINAWNEWAEGAHLEPDLRHGRAYLEATRRALLSSSSVSTPLEIDMSRSRAYIGTRETA